MQRASVDPVVRAREGCQQAFRQLVSAHSRSVFQICWRVTRDRTLAEDATQEAFLKAWRGLTEFDGRASFGTWLHRIAVNAALEQLRRNARHVDQRQQSDSASDEGAGSATDFLLNQADEQVPAPADHAAATALKRRVQDELAQMSGLERAAFTLRHIEGASLEDIAGALSLNIGQSKQAIFRAVRKLRVALLEWR